MKKYWLLKSEPTCYSIDDLARDTETLWTGVRNYQARNFMRDGMKAGDLVLFYHSSIPEPAVVGIAEISGPSLPDATALDKNDDHYDSKMTKGHNVWYAAQVRFKKKLEKLVTLTQIKFNPKLEGMVLTAPGSRLSVQPVSETHYKEIIRMGGE
jgi:predicted RNA-binding protein with PUA-like domain